MEGPFAACIGPLLTPSGGRQPILVAAQNCSWITSSAVANRVLGCWKSGAGIARLLFFMGSVTELQQTPMAGQAKNGAISKQEGDWK
jgi:hypothetical protein